MASSPRSPPAPTPEFEISRQSRLFAALLLGYLPNDRALWPVAVGAEELAKKRGQYAAFKGEFLRNPYSEIMEQIDRDVKRAHPDMHFFCSDSSFAKSNQESLKNALLIFAKLNAGIGYVQG
ncbi:hypothetical protein Zm00014a_015675 [Zea mays]|uniref:Ypt/Rab-GAP domain of gyp1p superfamily protein n=2 Tax=Zea mays TaxID=4577 RepID=A0A317YE78_MAIZE|nr:Ypt/Rab-GAP domain of gyp1p superfamily protein [Zea mays]PWZ30214.1 hypothetical protein Zm00014a_043936 [Zea mays]PWZ56965.1 hypothetical protein Zm00014a_015675 [Zea mays]